MRRRWSVAEKALLALWLSILAHAALLWLPVPFGSPTGHAFQGLRVRLAAREASPSAAPAAPPVESPFVPASAKEAASAGSRAFAPAGGEARLGADIYYPARELDRLAEEKGAIALPDIVLPPGIPSLTIVVFISEAGRVDAVRFEGKTTPQLEAAIAPVFRSADYHPARKNGQDVKSYKRIRIESQPDNSPAAPPLSH
ncbi:hypothetical protein [Chromobacterium sp. IIBBL 290-4]|uniref:hypothetical protein n=1 Tax=Chromobacterium sp. IIBBL 290-4 TaxID=2953890 RepID=UPI0020B64157|nr:hypothetical protein [Chromobacterium sp. IIBBL 290-4]UTH74336.1 hypothetical protein NKT35_22820 [Chromobacterium sp. IIBBL 290-4]